MIFNTETENNTTKTSAEEITEAPIAHTHIDFGSIDLNDKDAVAAIELDEITCPACLEAYAAHVGEGEDSLDGNLLAGVEFKPANFVSNLSYMGTGMVGIFIVIALIMGVTTLLNKLFSGKKNDAE